MRATGIVRRIDDLGRVVIPKELRRSLQIYDGAPLEIFTGDGGEVILRKFSQLGSMAEAAETYAKTLSSLVGLPCAICDLERIIAANGTDILGDAVPPQLQKLMGMRKNYVFDGENPLEVGGLVAAAACPIIRAGDLEGAVLTLCTDLEKLNELPAAKLGRIFDFTAACGGFLAASLDG